MTGSMRIIWTGGLTDRGTDGRTDWLADRTDYKGPKSGSEKNITSKKAVSKIHKRNFLSEPLHRFIAY